MEWSRGLGLFRGTVAEHLGEGAEVLPIVLISALGCLLVQHLVLPLFELLAPSYLKAVRDQAKAKAQRPGSDSETDGKLDSRACRAESEALTDIGVRFVALLFSAFVSYGALRLTFDPPPQFESNPISSSSPYAVFYCAVAAGYFLWDVVITVYYRYGGQFLTHAVAMLLVELIALHPFNQFVMSFSHLFELSSFPLNVRNLLIAGGRTRSSFFSWNEMAFGLSFFCVRIVYGYYKSFEYVTTNVRFLLGSESLISKHKGPFFVPVAWLSIALCLSLCSLNGFWFWLMVRKKISGGRGRTKSD